MNHGGLCFPLLKIEKWGTLTFCESQMWATRPEGKCNCRSFDSLRCATVAQDDKLLGESSIAGDKSPAYRTKSRSARTARQHEKPISTKSQSARKAGQRRDFAALSVNFIIPQLEMKRTKLPVRESPDISESLVSKTRPGAPNLFSS